MLPKHIQEDLGRGLWRNHVKRVTKGPKLTPVSLPSIGRLTLEIHLWNDPRVPIVSSFWICYRFLWILTFILSFQNLLRDRSYFKNHILVKFFIMSSYLTRCACYTRMHVLLHVKRFLWLMNLQIQLGQHLLILHQLNLVLCSRQPLLDFDWKSYSRTMSL